MLVEVTLWLVVKWTMCAGQQIASSQRANMIAILPKGVYGRSPLDNVSVVSATYVIRHIIGTHNVHL